jgi:uncharacterized protein
LVYKNIKFIYDEPALVANVKGKEYLVIADLHIGMELELSKKGVHLFNATDKLVERIKNIMKEFSLHDIIILGDVKQSILYPEIAEIKLLKKFFRELDGFEIKIVAGNHDAHLSEIIGHEVTKELIIGEFGFVHGNRKPSVEMMVLDYIISAHEHIAVRITEKSGAYYEQKAWALYDINKKEASANYEKFNDKIRLVSMPAFNDLIMGTTIDKKSKSRLNPLLSNNIFDYKSVDIYNLFGQKISLED